MKFIVMGIALSVILLFPQIAVSQNSAIREAAMLERATERATCDRRWVVEKDCGDFFGERLLKNTRLLEAFEYAGKKEVDIIISTSFYRGRGYVKIDVKATDEEILDFLMGKYRNK